MKKLILIFALLIISSNIEIEAKSRFDVSFGIFYSSLSSHGRWIEIDDGLVVWKPRIMKKRWSPYKYGEWVWTNYGWYWYSYEPFGYIVYHYGRWYYDDYYGWIWIPDYEWAPAWVEWRYDDNYIGWAPLHPYATFSISFGIRFVKYYEVHYNYWNFVTYNNFCGANVYNHFVPDKYKYRVYSNVKYRDNYTLRNNQVYNGGISRDDLERRGNIKVREMEVKFRDNQNIGAERLERNKSELYVDIPKTRESKDIRLDIANERNKSSLRNTDVIVGRERTNTERNLFNNRSSNNDKKNELEKNDRSKSNDVNRSGNNINTDRNRNNNIETNVQKEREVKTERPVISEENTTRTDARNEIRNQTPTRESVRDERTNRNTQIERNNSNTIQNRDNSRDESKNIQTPRQNNNREQTNPVVRERKEERNNTNQKPQERTSPQRSR